MNSSALELLASGDPVLEAQALATARRAYELAVTDERQNPGDWNLADLATDARLRLADLLEQNGRGGEALPLMREAGATVDQMLQHDPQGRRFRIVRLEQRSQFAHLLTSLGRLDEAASILAGVERDGDELARGDPNDISANSDRFTVLLYQIVLARKMGQVDRAMERCRRPGSGRLDYQERSGECGIS